MDAKESDRFTMHHKKTALRSAFGKKVLRIASVLSTTILLSSCLTSSVRAERKNIIFTETFEQGDLKQWGKEECCHAVVTYPTRSGQHAYQSLLKPAGKARAELKLNSFPKNSERWVGVSVYFPQGGDKGFVSFFQFHIRPDKGKSWTSPPFQVIMRGDSLSLRRYARGTAGSNQTWDLGPVTRGKWMDFVFHIKSSHTSNGLFEAWVNGVQKVNYSGATSLDYSHGPHVKMGVYVGIGNKASTETILYYDDLRIGDEKATYKDVAPGGD